MGRWRAASRLLVLAPVANSSPKPRFSSSAASAAAAAVCSRPLRPPLPPAPSRLAVLADSIFARPLSAVAARAYFDGDEPGRSCPSPIRDGDESENIPIKSYFLSTSIDLKSLQAENLGNVLPPTSRSSNYIALKFSALPSDIRGLGAKERASHCRYMVVFQYGSVILFNIDDHDIETYLKIVRRHASGLLPQTCKDDYAVKEQPLLDEDMEGGPDYIVLKSLDTDGIRIIGSVLGQSIALDYFVSQIDGMVEEFAYINRKMETTGTFTMDRKKLLQLVGKANSNLADVILKVGLFERSEIAWREAKYAQIYEYLREEYEVTQRFGNLNFKLKFVEHNIHFLQEVLQNNRSNLLEWCIIFLLSIENVISLYEILKDSIQVPI
ncbi:uncharacterized protein LOC104433417 [Eucalyptus grandis]|uniref:uncharacterized protein LOC104433417 n=1 Tax=Eucalyptus grandis TaxID=71139 RepID=UPI00192EA498|nr:uncharacterized protein LOC104433417 [Eucalyptus grandis]